MFSCALAVGFDVHRKISPPPATLLPAAMVAVSGGDGCVPHAFVVNNPILRYRYCTFDIMVPSHQITAVKHRHRTTILLPDIVDVKIDVNLKPMSKVYKLNLVCFCIRIKPDSIPKVHGVGHFPGLVQNGTALIDGSRRRSVYNQPGARVCWDLLRTHIFPRTRELPQFPISPKPLFLSKNRLRNPPKPVLKQYKKLCTYAQNFFLHICKVFGKKKVREREVIQLMPFSFSLTYGDDAASKGGHRLPPICVTRPVSHHQHSPLTVAASATATTITPVPLSTLSCMSRCCVSVLFIERLLGGLMGGTIIGFENGGINLGHLFHFAAYQFSVVGALPSAQHIPENLRVDVAQNDEELVDKEFADKEELNNMRVTTFIYPLLIRTSRHFYILPSKDFDSSKSFIVAHITKPGDTLRVFDQMLHMKPRISVYKIAKYITAIIKMEHYSTALSLFKQINDGYPE
ncbi:hypothetical protein LXL04_020755 [Taraxacum kok-saghyz]